VNRAHYLNLVRNHQLAMRLLFVRAYMRAGLGYAEACKRLETIGILRITGRTA